MSLLELHEIAVARNGTPVIHGVSLGVNKRESVCLLGRNGMGKTTLLRAIIGLSPLDSGRILFAGMDISRWPPHAIAKAGIGYVPQGRGMFPQLSVEENLLICSKRGDPRCLETVYALFPRLHERRRQTSGTLSGGEQQMLAIARCLALRPELMLLDEPTEGLQPSIIEDLHGTLRAIRHDLGVALLLVEQNLDFAFTVTDRGYVVEKGKIVSYGSVRDLRDQAVIKEYLAV